MFVKVNGKVCRVLLDTGASRSAVRQDMLKLLGAVMEPLPIGSFKVLAAADGHRLSVLGRVNLNVNLTGVDLPFHFAVLDKLNCDILFGLDILKDLGAQIDCVNGTVSFLDSLVTLNTLHRKDTGCVGRLAKKTVFPPRSETLVAVKVPKACGSVCLIERLAADPYRALTAARTVSRISGGSTVCRLLNPSDRAIKLKAGSKVATICKAFKVVADGAEFEPSFGRDWPANQVNSVEEPGERRGAKVSTIANLGLKLDAPALSEAQKAELELLLEANADIFATSSQQLPGCNLHQHRINTGDAVPQRRRAYRLSPIAKKEIGKQVQDLLDADIVEPSHSMWSAPTVLVKKKDGSMRMCIDYRMLNAVTKPINFPIPLWQDVLDAVSEARPTIFSSLDLKSGYHQILLDPDSRDKTSFSTHMGSFRFKRLPFGLQNAPSSFQMLMSEVFHGLGFKFVIYYLDDVLIYSRGWQDHKVHLEAVFSRLRKANLKLHPSKCHFAMAELLYLGHVIGAGGVRVDESKIELVKKWPTPRSTRDVRSFVGYCSYYRRYVKNFASIVAPLNRLLQKDVEFDWTPDCEVSFQQLKTMMSSTPILSYPDMAKEFILATDASTSAIGWVLSQKGDDGREHPISFGGRGLRQNEKGWSIMDLEALALVTAIKENSVYLCHKKFTVYTDNISLTWFKSIKPANSIVFRWALLVQQYNFDILHKSGVKNNNADSLSRRSYSDPPAPDPNDNILNDDLSFSSLFDMERFCDCNAGKEASETRQELRENVKDLTEIRFEKWPTVNAMEDGQDEEAGMADKQRKCPDLSPIIDYLETGDLPGNDKVARRIVFQAPQFFMKQGCLYHCCPYKNEELNEEKGMNKTLVVPTEMVKDLLYQYHDVNGHPGADRLLHAVRDKYYFVNMYSTIRKYVKSCDICQRTKRHAHFKRAPLQPLPAVDVFARFHMDFLGPLPITAAGYKHILLVVESLSRWPIAIPLKDQTAVEVAKALYDNVFTVFGCPVSLLTDRAQDFVGNLITELCKLFQVKRLRTSAYRPQTNSACEKFNSTILKCLRCYCEDQDKWDEVLPSIMCAYRATPCIYSTGFSPFCVLFGREMRLPLDNDLNPPNCKSKDIEAYIGKVIKKIELIRKVARENVEASQETSKSKYDVKSRATDYKVGDRVLLYCPRVPASKSPKLWNRYWTGPYYICEKVGNVNYAIRNCETQKRVNHPVHSDRLKPYHEDDTVHSDPRSQSVTQQTTDWAENNNNNDNDESETGDSKDTFYIIRALTGLKYIKGKKHYRVVWDIDGSKTWEPEGNIPPLVKQEYHIKRTQEGKLRKQFRRRR